MERLEEVIEGINNNQSLLPNFQREFVWNTKQQKDLIASVISSVPASSSLLVEENNFEEPTFTCIKVGRRYSEVEIEHNRPFYYILDGQQRFTTLYFAFTNVFNNRSELNETTFREMDYKIKLRWFLNFQTESGYLFNYDTLIFDKEECDQYLPNDLINFISDERIRIDNIRRSNDEYISFLRSQSLADKKIPLQLFLMKEDESYNIKRWLEILKNERINALRVNEDNRDSLINIFKTLNVDNPEKTADDLYRDDKVAIEVFKECIKNNKIIEWHDRVYNFLKNKIANYQ